MIRVRENILGLIASLVTMSLLCFACFKWGRPDLFWLLNIAPFAFFTVGFGRRVLKGNY